MAKLHKTVSIKFIINRIYSRFGIRDDDTWVNDALEWIGDLLPDLMLHPILEQHTSDFVDVVGHRVPIPCDCLYLEAVETEDGYRLPRGLDETGRSLPVKPRTTLVKPIYESDVTGNVFEQNPENQGTTNPVLNIDKYGSDIVPKNVGPNAAGPHFDGRSYQLNPNFIVTSFETGKIKLHYDRFHVGEDGLPQIPMNSFDHIECLIFYVARNLKGAGYEFKNKELSYQYLDAKFESKMQDAQNAGMFPDPEDMEAFRRSWVRMIHQDNRYRDFSIGAETSEKIFRG